MTIQEQKLTTMIKFTQDMWKQDMTLRTAMETLL